MSDECSKKLRNIQRYCEYLLSFPSFNKNCVEYEIAKSILKMICEED